MVFKGSLIPRLGKESHGWEESIETVSNLVAFSKKGAKANGFRAFGVL
jgi:hypothetical protein